MAKKAETKKETGVYLQALARVKERLNSTGLPWPKKPEGYGSEYTFPADISTMSGAALGKLQGHLAGWGTYADSLIARVDINMSLLQVSYDVALGEKMVELDENGSKGKLKDILKAQALNAVPELKRATFVLAEKKALVRALKAQKGIYETQRQTLSREQSRRSDEMRARLRSD